jgi:hypothetical protein
MSPTARSLEHLRTLGYRAQTLERWNPFARIRQDVFGADLIALKPGQPVLVVQCTTGSNHASRRTKLATLGFIALWTSVGVTLEVWSWAKQGPRGKRKTWTLRREAL